MIGGLIPEVVGTIADDMRQALEERRELIEARADAVIDAAVAAAALWVSALGEEPLEPHRAATWRHSASVNAAYRDRYQVASAMVFGAPSDSTTHKIDRARAEAALRVIQTLARSRRPEISAGSVQGRKLGL